MRTSRIISIVLAISVLLSVTAVLQGCKKTEEPASPVEQATEAVENAATEQPEHPTTENIPEHPAGEHPK